MKRLVSPSIDPLPRSISLKSLALVVATLLSGVGISVRGYLISRQVPERARFSTPAVREECTREERSPPLRPEPRPTPAQDLRAPQGERWSAPRPKPVAATRISAP